MQRIWIVAADASRARIFELDGAGKKIHEIEDFAHPQGRAATRELRSDAQGRYYGKGDPSAAHDSQPRMDPVEHENELFSKSLAEYLDQARMAQRYAHLRIMAPPKFLGLLRQKLHKEVQKLVEAEVPKDVAWFDSQDIERVVRGEDVAAPRAESGAR